MQPQDIQSDLRDNNECSNLPDAMASVASLFGYVTMVFPFATVLIGLFSGMWGMSQLVDAATAMFPRWTAEVTMVATGVKLLLVLMAGRTMFLTVTILAAFLPKLVEFIRREFRKDFDL